MATRRAPALRYADLTDEELLLAVKSSKRPEVKVLAARLRRALDLADDMDQRLARFDDGC